MDPTNKPGSNWPNLKPPEKLEILYRYRDLCKKRKDFSAKADDYFVQTILDENLEQAWIDDMSNNNRN